MISFIKFAVVMSAINCVALSELECKPCTSLWEKLWNLYTMLLKESEYAIVSTVGISSYTFDMIFFKISKYDILKHNGNTLSTQINSKSENIYLFVHIVQLQTHQMIFKPIQQIVVFDYLILKYPEKKTIFVAMLSNIILNQYQFEYSWYCSIYCMYLWYEMSLIYYITTIPTMNETILMPY